MGGSSQSMRERETSHSLDRAYTTTSIPSTISEPLLVTYRSVGIGLYGVAMRFMGMPLEKIALYLNSSQVVASSGQGQFRQAIQLTFREGYVAPYRVVGPASLAAWFFQYSVMGFAFQFFDHSLSQILHVQPVYYGAELMTPKEEGSSDHQSTEYCLKYSFKTALAPLLSAGLESMVSNRAEVQRYYGREQFASIETSMMKRSILSRTTGLGMAFAPNLLRNQVMCSTTFLLTPITYKLYFPQEYKNPSTLFWYGLGMNIFVGNAVAITQQALWGRSLDFLALRGTIDYQQVIRQGLQQEGMKAFFTIPKWSSRVMMNAPAQGVLPWFYNEVLPLGESMVLKAFEAIVYEPFLLMSQNDGSRSRPSTTTTQHRTLRIFATREKPTILSTSGRLEHSDVSMVSNDDEY